jgi:ABC-type glutathione transport system ATPase component
MSSLLAASDVVVDFPRKGFRRRPFRALHGVSIDIRRGETLGLVGESGSGKTTLGRAILGLVPVTSGTVTFEGRDITHLPRRDRRRLAADIQVVFQDPYGSLNPAMTIGDILAEPLLPRRGEAIEARQRILELLDAVNLPADAVDRYPREFSGGQRQRVAIARALALEPKLIVCDEPVSALDLSTQSRVLELLVEIQDRTGVAYLFVSHDLSVVRAISHRVAVMYQGEIVEQGDGDVMTSEPAHDYSRRLLMAAPVADPVRQAERRAERHALLTARVGEDS